MKKRGRFGDRPAFSRRGQGVLRTNDADILMRTFAPHQFCQTDTTQCELSRLCNPLALPVRCRYLLCTGQTDVAPLVTVVERQHSSRRPHPVLRRLLCGNPVRCRYLLCTGQTDVAPLVTVVERQHSSRRPHPVLRRLLCGNPVRCRYLLYAGQTDVAPLVTVVERQHSSRRQVSLPTVCRPDGRSSTGNCSRVTALLTEVVRAFASTLTWSPGTSVPDGDEVNRYRRFAARWRYAAGAPWCQSSETGYHWFQLGRSRTGDVRSQSSETRSRPLPAYGQDVTSE